MSYERQRTVQDGERVVLEKDFIEDFPNKTRGGLVFGISDEARKAHPLLVTGSGELATSDPGAEEHLGEIVELLRIIAFHLKAITELDIDEGM